MVYTFGTWAQEIERISTLPEFQNAAVVIYIPAHGGEYDVDTGEYTGETEAELIYSGQCRVVGIRSWRENGENYNPSSLKPIRFQVKREEISGLVPANAKAYFTDGGRNPQLTEYLFNINSDFNSSQVAAYTFEVTVDLEAEDTDRPTF